jgi:RNA polymerase sigma factor (sigma-70 family)
VDGELLRSIVPEVLGVLVRRGNDFPSAEDAVQDAVLDALRSWDRDPPADPKGWLIRVATRRLIDARRSDASRLRREEGTLSEPPRGPTEQADDTLLLLFLCCRPTLAPASAMALTLRAVGGLTTRQVAEAFLVPEATMAQRISRAKRAVAGERFIEPGDIAVVCRVLYLIFTAGHGGAVDLAAEAIRLTRLLARLTPDPEVAGLLALMLLTHARRPARTDASGRLVPLDEQDRTLWDTAAISEGVNVLRAALAVGRRGPYQVQAAIAALHDDAAVAAETDWPQILDWYDELVAFVDDPVARLNRAVAVGEVDGPLAGLQALDGLDARLPGHHRVDAVRGHLHARAGHADLAAAHYRRAADRTTSSAEREHLTRLAAIQVGIAARHNA